ncbi:PrpF domain-containing protein [uncultured Cetobacterium sp.]|uniref:2-methylaconitate cis-trans isomerase PrpF family protein n=1 Tax=uncultured Cetobacterium sp. TaxID=527638 RepID=UPI0025F485D6|nr:PrpF domain-containing protein [uncultured Cetobacterium sp.]
MKCCYFEKESLEIKCSIVRGGTSKGIFIMENELPKDQKLRDKIILSIFGSPDVRQIDGLGGADTLTSKLAIIGPSTRKDADIDYTFGQVSFVDSFVDYGGNCGNISSGVGVYAVDNGLVEAIEPITKVKVHLTNTKRILEVEVPVKNGKAIVNGDFKIDGVPGTGAKITLDWSDVVGGITGKLLPTGNAKDIISIGNESFEVSVVDAGNIVIFIEAEKLGLIGTETASEIDNNKELMNKIERIRGEICFKLGLVDSWEKAAKETPYQPFFAMVSRSQNYKAFNGIEVSKEDVDIVSRLVFMLKMHKTYPVTGTVGTGAIARVKGSIVYNLLSQRGKENDKIEIGHPGGVIPVESTAEYIDNECKITRLGVYRTARIILDGRVFVNLESIK